MATISWNLEQLGPNFALHTATTQDMCVHQDLCKLRALSPEQRFDNTFLDPPTQPWRLQTNQTHIGPTLHVESNDKQEHHLNLLDTCWELLRESKYNVSLKSIKNPHTENFT